MSGNSWYRLYDAVCMEDEELVAQLLAFGDSVDVEKLNEYYEMTLWRLITCDSRSKRHMLYIDKKKPRLARIAEMLIKAGANVNSMEYYFTYNYRNDTLLHEAVKRGSPFAVDLLLKNGIIKCAEKPNHIFIQLEKALCPCSQSYCGWLDDLNLNLDHQFQLEDLNIVKSLLIRVRDINALYKLYNNPARTILHFALSHSQDVDYYAEVIKYLLECGVDVNIRDEVGWNPIEYYLLRCCDWGICPRILKLLPLNNMGMSPLHKACICNDYNYVRELATRPDVQINAEDRLGYTPLMYAAAIPFWHSMKDTVSKVKLLLTLGADTKREYREYSWCFDLPKVSIKVALYFYGASIKSRDILNILVQHEAILHQLNSDKKDHIGYYETYNLQVLKEMKKYMVDDDVSLFDLLTADTKKSATYAKNKRIVSALETSASERKFLIYQEWMLHTNFGLALERRKLLDLAATKLCIILKFADPSNQFYEKSLSYLSNQDLRRLLDLEGISVENLMIQEIL